MTSRKLRVLNKAGIHARPANLIAKTAQKFTSRITLTYKGITANAKSIMGVITLGATEGAEILLISEGEDEEISADAIEAVFLRRFDED